MDSLMTELEESLRKISGAVNKKTKENLDDLNLTLPRFFALYIIAQNEGISMGELHEKLYLANSTVTGIIDGLVKEELAQRERDTDDRRVVRITTTTQGQEVLREVIELRKNFFEELTDQFTKDELMDLVGYLSRLEQVLRN